MANPSPILSDDANANDAAKDEAVGDVSRAIDIPAVGTVEVYESINKNGRYYIAPQLRFNLLDPPQVGRLSGIEAEGTTECQFSLLMLAPNVRETVAERLSALLGKAVQIEDVGNLRVYAIMLDVSNELVKKKFGVRSYIITNPTYSQTIDVGITLNSDDAAEFENAVNEGRISFRLSYVYKPINIDNRIEKLDLNIVRNSQTLRKLDQQGKELMKADQMAETGDSIVREITSTVIQGLGTIQPESLPVSRLLELFDLGDVWKQDEEVLRSLDEKLRKQFNLNVDPADFQPFRVQKHVVETLNKETDVAKQRYSYDQEHNSNKKKWNVSGGFSYGPWNASGGYSEESERVTDNVRMSNDDFKEMLKKYHGVEYNTEEKLWRGVKIYDLSKIKSSANTNIISVTYKPKLGTGVRNNDVRPSTASLIENPPIFSTPVGSANLNAPRQFYFNWQGDENDRHDMFRVSANTWVEKLSDGRIITLTQITRTSVDANSGTVLRYKDSSVHIFVPDISATGDNNTMMRQSNNGPNGPWENYQYMLDIK